MIMKDFLTLPPRSQKPRETGISLVMGALSTIAWALFGSSLRAVLTSPRAVRAFNLLMAALLLASLYPVFMDA